MIPIQSQSKNKRKHNLTQNQRKHFFLSFTLTYTNTNTCVSQVSPNQKFFITIPLKTIPSPSPSLTVAEGFILLPLFHHTNPHNPRTENDIHLPHTDPHPHSTHAHTDHTAHPPLTQTPPHFQTQMTR